MRKSLFLIFVVSMILNGCTNYVRSDVTRFHSPSGLSEEKTFVFLPTPAQYKSLEYKNYGNVITSEMQANGFRFVKSKSSANYGVRFNYGSDGGQTIVEQDPFYGTVGVGHSGRHGTGVNVGVGTVFGRGGRDVDVYTEYARQFSLDIIDLSKDKPVFEGTVVSRGNASSFAPVSACLIAAMFENFPGENGKTQHVSIDARSCAQ
ncbi:MAG: DUF4136 domain-containing protein [Pseudomonadota bacterium]